jgi:myosin-5
VQPSYLLELQRRAVMAEKALREKEEDNALLRQRLQHYEARWMEYEAKMSSMEEVWQKQMSSLQLSLAAAKKSLATDESILPTPTKEEPVDLRATLSKHNYAVRRLMPPDEEDFDFDEDASHFTKSPERVMNKYLQTGPEYASSRGDLDTGRAVVSQLVAEYDHRKQVFTDDVDFLVEVKSGVTEANLNPEEELRKLKLRFDAWKKDFKLRLRDTKVVLHKLCNGDSLEKERTRKKWWGKRTTP